MKNIDTETGKRPLARTRTGEIRGVKDVSFSGKRIWAPALLTALITLAVFLPALKGEFVSYDDDKFVYDNRHIASMDLDFVKWALTNRQYQWSPLRWISHAVDYRIWGLNAAGHHLSSIVLHSLNAFLVVVLVVRLLETARPRGPAFDAEKEAKFREKALIAGFAAGLLFGVHPLRVESVAWVAERKDVLFAFFYLLGLVSYLHYCSSSENRRRLMYYLFTLVFFVMAVMSKGAAVTFPLVLILVDFYPLERVNLRSGSSVWRRVLAEKLPFLVVGAAVTWINIGVHESMGVLMPLGEVPFVNRVLLASKAIAFYLVKTVWPFHLTLIYGEPYKVSFSIPEYVGLFLFVPAVTALCIFLWYRGKRLWLAIWAYYIVMLLPVSVVKVLSFSFAHDRYTYMPSIGPFLLAGLGAAFLMEKTKGRNKVVVLSLLAIVPVFLAGLTIRQEAVWKNSVTLWSSVIEHTPRFIRAYYDRGAAYLAAGNYRDAIADLNHTIKLTPFEEAYNKRGLAYKEAGDYEDAVRDFSKAIEMHPGYVAAYNNRADAYVRTGDYQKASEDLARALKWDPKYNVTYINLCTLKNLLGNYREAVRECSFAIETDPDNSLAYKRRGFSFNALGNYREALRDYDRAVALNSGDYEAYNLRGITHKNNGEPSLAVLDFTSAIALNPGFFDAYLVRGVTYGELGRLEDAVNDFSAAIRLRPKDASAYYNRGAAQYRLGREKEAMKDFKTAAGLGDKDVQKILKDRGIKW